MEVTRIIAIRLMSNFIYYRFHDLETGTESKEFKVLITFLYNRTPQNNVLTKDLGCLWLAYIIRIMHKAGTLVFWCSLSSNAV